MFCRAINHFSDTEKAEICHKVGTVCKQGAPTHLPISHFVELNILLDVLSELSGVPRFTRCGHHKSFKLNKKFFNTDKQTIFSLSQYIGILYLSESFRNLFVSLFITMIDLKKYR